MAGLGKTFLVLGGIFLLIGLGLLLAARFNLPLGKLPGDLKFERDGLTVYFPLATMIVVSAALTILLNLLARFLRK